MIKKYVFGEPFETEAVVENIPGEEGMPKIGEVSLEEGFSFTMHLEKTDVVYGLGENVRGINKRGFLYKSDASDNNRHHEDAHSLYGGHNFLLIAGEKATGLFFDYPTYMTFDVGYTRMDTLKVSADAADLKLYVIEGESLEDIVREFRGIIGRSYIPPKFAFGFGQSRWGYIDEADFREVVKKFKEYAVPLDMVYMDIDYMEAYKDFTINTERFPDFPGFVRDLKEEGVRLIPIIDAGVKIEQGYDVYEEGVEKGYFVHRPDGSEFVAAVWPGDTHFPDVLNPEARAWFGGHYKFLIDQGIEGFWNDMNEPAIFYTPERLAEVKELAKDFAEGGKTDSTKLGMALSELINNHKDHENMVHHTPYGTVSHSKVHNLFGYNMTRAAGEAFEKIDPEKRFLMFSRSSYVGMHRYGGIWMGDNTSWWSQILLNLQMLPSLNMIGILYTGADIGGFMSDATRDLVLRWTALGVFTPLMRNHSADLTRRQEFYQFEDPEDFRHVISVRYRLVPYLYSEFMKAALKNDMMFKPLGFLYPDDEFAVDAEDQLFLGNEVMIAPVYRQNAIGRMVYLPEEMLFVKFIPDGSLYQEVLPKGHHFVKVALNEVPMFIRSGKCIPLCESAMCVEKLDTTTLTMVGFENAEYELYEDDGIGKDYDLEKNIRIVKK